MPNPKLKTSAPLVIALAVFVMASTFVMAQPTYAIGKCYPNACVGPLADWPFGGTPPLALVAAGSPPYGDLYNLTAHLKYLGISPDQSLYQKLKYLNNKTYGIAIGFTSLGEFVAQLAGGTAGGISLATYNRPNLFARYESWATQYPYNWINGWTLSVNATASGNNKQYNIYIHAFAVYSNGTQAGGGRGVVINVTSPGTVPGKWIWMPLNYADLTIIYDSPRLLIANGTVWFNVDLGKIKEDLTGAYIRGRVRFTLVFPKAYPYAIIYYNYSVTAGITLVSTYTVTITGLAFSIRNDIMQPGLTANATIFRNVNMGDPEHRIKVTLLQATPSGYPNVTLFEMLYPEPDEYTAYNTTHLLPSKFNNYNITLPTGYRNSSVANTVPYVIYQYKKQLSLMASAPNSPATYSSGVMMIYGYAVNTTAWINLKKNDTYIVSLLNYTVFVENKASTQKYLNAAVVPARGHMADVLGATYVAQAFNTVNSTLDIAPLGVGATVWNPYPFLSQSRSGVVPVALCTLGGPFVDRYGRPFFKTWLFLNGTGFFKPLTNYTIYTVAGPRANLVTRMAQDFAWFAPYVSAYGDQFSGSNNYTAGPGFDGRVVSTVWNKITINSGSAGWPVKPRSWGLGVVSKAVTPNGTIIVQVWGFDPADTYWTSYVVKNYLAQDIKDSPFQAFVIRIYYGNVTLPSKFDIYKVSPTQSFSHFNTISTPFG